MRDDVPAGGVLLRALGMFALFLAGWLLVRGMHPALNAVDARLREVAVVVYVLVLVALALAATWRPAALADRRLVKLGVAALVVGTACTGVGLVLQSAPVLAVGCVAESAGRAVAAVVACAACAGLDTRRASACIAAAYLAAFVVVGLVGRLHLVAGVVVFLAMPPVALGCGWASGGKALERGLLAEPPGQAAIAKPSTLLPFGHQLFMTLLLFRAVYGYMLECDASWQASPAVFWACVVVLSLVALAARRSEGGAGLDRLFDGSALLVLAGALLLFAGIAPMRMLAGALLYCGVGCFEVMAYCALVALARRNPANAAVVFAWGQAVYGTGVALGAFVGRSTTGLASVDPQGASLVWAVVLFVFVAYAVVFMRGFSFRASVEGVEAPDSVTVPMVVTASLDERCAALARERGLTARESEVMALLAQGRNVAYVQESLVLARNTVKVHVRHIYTKLDVHSQQELIDLVVG